MGALPGLLSIPFVNFFLYTIIIVVFLGIMAFTMSAGDIKAKDGTIKINGKDVALPKGALREFKLNDQLRNFIFYQLFMYFWFSCLVTALGQLINAIAVALWQFTQSEVGKEKREEFGVWSPTARAWKVAFRYHLGTVLFGSLIVAIIKTIRAILTYIQNKTKGSENKAIKIILCVLQCCMWCLEKCMEFLNKNAYIQTAIKGTNFCTSAKNAFFTLLRNIRSVMATILVKQFMSLIGKLMIMLSGPAVA